MVSFVLQDVHTSYGPWSRLFKGDANAASFRYVLHVYVYAYVYVHVKVYMYRNMYIYT